MLTCENPVLVTKNLNRWKYPDGLMVPCGKCMMCKVAYRREWSMRLVHEQSYWEKSSFITLTYDEDNLPEKGSLVKRDLQNFFKRLRKRIEPEKIKYYGCGEYGDSTGRPHYHSIIFGLSPKDHDTILQAWSFGRIHVAGCEPKSIDYVTRYIDKKFYGNDEETFYTSQGLLPVFRIVSQGLGKRYALDNSEHITKNLDIRLFSQGHSVPRYYLDVLNVDQSLLDAKRSDIEAQTIEHYTGISDLSLHNLVDYDYNTFTTILEKIKKSNQQKARNMKARINLRKRKF